MHRLNPSKSINFKTANMNEDYKESHQFVEPNYAADNYMGKIDDFKENLTLAMGLLARVFAEESVDKSVSKIVYIRGGNN